MRRVSSPNSDLEDVAIAQSVSVPWIFVYGHGMSVIRVNTKFLNPFKESILIRAGGKDPGYLRQSNTVNSWHLLA